MRVIIGVFVLLLCISGGASRAAENTPRGAVYQTRYMLAGYLLRAGTVCEAESKRTITAAFSLVATEELKAMSNAYPATTERWMTEGADNFNTEVMKNGIKPACASAMADRQHVEGVSKSHE
jgi:hypothetical protein